MNKTICCDNLCSTYKVALNNWLSKSTVIKAVLIKGYKFLLWEGKNNFNNNLKDYFVTMSVPKPLKSILSHQYVSHNFEVVKDLFQKELDGFYDTFKKTYE